MVERKPSQRKIMTLAGRKYTLSEFGEIPGIDKVLGQVEFFIGKRDASPSSRPIEVFYFFPTTKEELATLDRDNIEAMLPKDPIFGQVVYAAQGYPKKYTHPGDAIRKLREYGFSSFAIEVATNNVPKPFSVLTPPAENEQFVSIVERGLGPIEINKHDPRHIICLKLHPDLLEQP